MKSALDEIRIDQWLKDQGLANSRTHAASLIEARQVQLRQGPPHSADWVTLEKPSYKVPTHLPVEAVRIVDGPANRYVSRGGLKLEGALEEVGLQLQDRCVLDIGVSTGGFTDCCLQRGAAAVVGIDVGHGQLAPSLSKYKNFTLLEGINAKNLPELRPLHPELQKSFDLIVGDLSFISITAVIPHLAALLGPQGCILFLVKPQFELDSKALNKNGVVKDPRSYVIVKDKVLSSCQQHHLKVEKYFESRIEGKDGNKEFFVFATVETGAGQATNP